MDGRMLLGIIITMIIVAVFTFIITAVASASVMEEREAEAYRRGFEDAMRIKK